MCKVNGSLLCVRNVTLQQVVLVGGTGTGATNEVGRNCHRSSVGDIAWNNQVFVDGEENIHELAITVYAYKVKFATVVIFNHITFHSTL